MTNELPEAVCGDCIAFTPQTSDAHGVRGPCRFRPELGLIPQELPVCSRLQVRRERVGKVQGPPPASRAGASRPRARSGGASQESGAERARCERTRTSQSKSTNRSQRPTLEDLVEGETTGVISMDRDGLKQVLRELLEAETLYGYPDMGQRFQGGTMVLKPADEELQSKELPLETFFHKIVMLRDRLRVLEARINGHDKLSEQDKVELQGYVSKCYGSLTTFNVLFADKADQFSSR